MDLGSGFSDIWHYMEFNQLSFEPCPVCGGDARASLQCKACQGAGVVLRSADGPLVWTVALEPSLFAFRKFRQTANAVFHISLAAVVIACFGWFIFKLVSGSYPLEILTAGYWLNRQPELVWFWFGVMFACFLGYRLHTHSDFVKPLPNWGKTKRQLAVLEAAAAKRVTTQDVSVYFQTTAWGVIESAFGLAMRVNRTELDATHLFAAALSSSAGGIFLTRLGLDFDKIKAPLAELIRSGQAGAPTHLSLQAKQVLLAAYEEARSSDRKAVGPVEVFIAAFEAEPRLQDLLDTAGYPPEHVRHAAEWIRIQEGLKEQHDRFVALAALKPSTAMNRTMTARPTPLLDRFSEDFTRLARSGYLAPLVGREHEMEELLRGIESGRRSVVLVGEPGVGKQALIEGLARRMVEENVPLELFDKRLVSVNMAQLVGAGDPSLASQRLLSLLREVALAGNIILVMEGIEALSGAGSAGVMDLAETLASELNKGYFIVIATTTPGAWTGYLERRTLGTKLIKVNVPEMPAEDALRTLLARSGHIEYQNKVFFSFAAIDKAVNLAGRFMRDIRLPESALNIIQEAAVLVHREKGELAMVQAEDVARIVHDKTNIPVEAVTQSEADKLLNLETRMHGRVIGQEEAVTAVAQALRRARAEVREGKRPIANFLFLGPTGVGKTELAKTLAAEYFGNESAMVRVDMSEYQSPNSIARMIGEPGDERGGLLTEAVRRSPFTVVLLDELEKAHPDILTLFLQVMDDGRLTDGVGRTIDFTNTVVIATSNAGTSYIQQEVSAGTSIERIKTALLEQELKGIFRPEFLNRFDSIIVFKPLTLDDVTQIAWLMLHAVGKRLEGKGIGFRAEDEAVEELARAGFDPLFGARPLRRVIQERVENQLADLILKNAVARKQTIVLTENGELKVE